MNVLVISWYDSHNFALPPIVRILLDQGHDVEVVVTQSAHEHNRMFNSLQVPKHDGVGKLRLDQFDVALYGALPDEELVKRLRQNDVFQVSLYYYLVPDEKVIAPHFTNADITFCFGERLVRNQRSHGIIHELIPIGSPQYDTLSKPVNTDIGVLILEKHSYPVGDAGKRQFASMILDIANSYRDRRVIVKPRTIPSQIESATHQSKHIYEFVDEVADTTLPSNLVLLTEHKDLNDLVSRSDIIVTTISTAAVPAMLLEKPLVFVRGFDHTPTYHVNNERVAVSFDLLEETGCVTPYDEVVGAIDDASTVSDEFLADLYADQSQSVAPKIVEILESIDEIIGLEKPLPVLDLRYEDHRETLQAYQSKQTKPPNQAVRNKRWFERLVAHSLFEIYKIHENKWLSHS